MKTDELIDLLAGGDGAAASTADGARARAHAWPLLAALLVSGVVLLTTLGARRDLAAALALPAFWLKLVFCLALAGAAWQAVKRLAVPGARLAALPWLIGLPIALLWAVAALLLAPAAPAVRAELFWGSTWRYCPALITLMAAPVSAAALYVLRGLAPTRLRLAGAGAGLAGGAMAAAVYCLHCPEMSPVFVGFWYLLGILIPAAVGALIGPRVLVW